MMQRRTRTAFGYAVVAAAVLLTGCSRSPESTVKKFYRAVGEGEITEAQSYMSAEVVGMMGPSKMSAGLAQEAERIQECGGIDSVDVELEGEGEIRNGTATITYEGDCEARSETIKLRKEDGEWKLGMTK